MDGARFDRFARLLSSRRGMLRTVLAASAAVGGARLAGAQACSPTGVRCTPSDNTCWSGSCQKRHGKHKCAKSGLPFGCGKDADSDFCRNGGQSVTCPDAGGIGACIVDKTRKKKQAICAGRIECVACQSDDDCTQAVGNPTARCVERCGYCDGTGQTACIIPVRPPR